MASLTELVDRIRIESAYLPTIVLDHPFDAGAPPNPLLQLLKPRITLEVAGKEVTTAPYGDPGPTRWPAVRAALLVGGGVLALSLIRRPSWLATLASAGLVAYGAWQRSQQQGS